MAPPRVVVTTAAAPGAVALLQLHGEGTLAVAIRFVGRDLPTGRLRLCRFDDIDEGLAVALRDDWVQLMPHGGPRVVQRLVDRLIELGCVYDPEPDPRDVYPEAASPVDADMLAAIARAASPAAIDLLAAQPALWREVAERGGDEASRRGIAARSAELDRLLDPPSVVVVGRPNVGKSTLTNAMLGRAASIVADLPGTTRDWVAGLAELGPPADAVAVRWMDTPGLRESDDPIEREAIAMAKTVLGAADVLIAMRDPQIDWPEAAALPRRPDVWVVNKVDDAHGDPGRGTREHPLRISAANDRGLDTLQSAVLGTLGLAAPAPGPWAFSPTLKRWLLGEPVALGAYLLSR